MKVVMKEIEQPETALESEIVARRDAALLRALSTPHKKQADMKKGKRGSAGTDPRPLEEVMKDGGNSPEARR